MKRCSRKRLPVMKLEEDARLGRKGFHPALEIVIFIAVFYVSSAIQSIPLTFMTVLALLSSPELKEMVDRIASDSSSLSELPEMIEELTVTITESLMLPSLFLTVSTVVAVFLYCRLIERRPFRSLGFRKGQILGEYLVGLAVGTGLFALAVGICALTGTLSISFVAKGAMWLIPLYFLGFVIQGMSEELLCRGFMMVSISRRSPIVLAILLNSLAFAALHLMNPGVTLLSILNLVLFGVFASVYFLKRGNIWGIGALHTAWNFVQGNFFGISVSGMTGTPSILASTSKEGFLNELINGGAFGLEGGLAVTLVLVLATVVMLFIPAKRSEIAAVPQEAEGDTADTAPQDDGQNASDTACDDGVSTRLD